MPKPIHITPLIPSNAGELLHYWSKAHPLHPLDLPMLTERLFGPPAADPELLLAARNDAGDLIGIAAGVYPCRKEGIGGIRWIGALPGEHWEEVLEILLKEISRRLERLGANELHMFATPPHYIRPGIDTRETSLIAALLSRGWTHSATHFNMTCDLHQGQNPGEQKIFTADAHGYFVRRGNPDELASIRALIEKEWTPGWRDAATLAFDHHPISLFVAEKSSELVGFAAYEVDQCLGTFGPTGVATAHRGFGLGSRLLNACLADLQSFGRQECQIGWVGPVPFYHRVCGAQIGPCYWVMGLTL